MPAGARAGGATCWGTSPDVRLGLQGAQPPATARRARGGEADDSIDDRGTIPEVFDPLHAEFDFTLDVAASNRNHKVPRYFTRAVDGLTQPWTGERVWCNPPYSACGAWVEKAVRETCGNGCPLVVMLLPNNRCEQKWWQKHVEPFRDRGQGVNVRFLKGRPRFIQPPEAIMDKRGDRPPFGLVVVVFKGLDLLGDIR
jgi:phage N-6-adenine-methyltransferase